MTFLQYLEYETVLGPEADDETAKKKQQAMNMNEAGPGAPALTGGAVPAQSMLSTRGDGTKEKTGPTMANQGTGLGDLLTHSEGTGSTGNAQVSLTL